MNIEISKSGLNFGTDLEYISTFIKGTKKPSNPKNLIERYRILVRNLKTDEKFLLYLETMFQFAGKDRYQVSWIDGDQLTFITPTHIRNKSSNEVGDGHEVTSIFNYHDIGYDPKSVEDFFQAWISSDPLVYTGGMTHQFASVNKNYTWSYKFNNKTF
jgi:hypothetical protein